jgi:serine/threonine protein kinase
VPKVIDFGVAKAIEQRLTEKSVYTQFGTLVGTFEYMSPEQAEMNAFGVDTRSDIYALGVLLYELMSRFRRDSADHQGGGAAAAKRPPEHVGHADQGGGCAQDRAGEAVAADARRAGLGGDALPGEGPFAALRHRQ